MVKRSSRLAVLLAIVPAVVVGCRQEQGSPMELPTVRLAVVAGAEHGGRPYSTGMTQEVTTSPPWQGDVDGAGLLACVALGAERVREVGFVEAVMERGQHEPDRPVVDVAELVTAGAHPATPRTSR